MLKPASPHLMSEVAIVCNLAAATLKGRTTVDWLAQFAANYDRIRDHIERVFVPGFENYNQRVRKPGGFLFTEPAARQAGISHRRRQSEVHGPSDSKN